MTTRFRILPILSALAFFFVISSAQAGEAQGEAGVLLQRAEALIRQGQYKQAAVEFERASQLSGGRCAECLLGVARAYSGAGQHDSAVQVTRMAISLFSSRVEKARAYNQLGSVLAQKGDLAGAREAYNKAVELDPELADQVRSNLAEALLKRAGATGESGSNEGNVVIRGAGAP